MPEKQKTPKKVITLDVTATNMHDVYIILILKREAEFFTMIMSNPTNFL